ncbi:hypothetical protein [Sphingorhabdus sp.]|uniref:hypothetical protein n=1 Tax=Sphingorhabdus sp. TaxID=1902408 RepID=UPI00333E9EA5
MTDRDYFAAAALTRGMGVLGYEQIAKSCYEMADVMLRERERHHIPDAGKMVPTLTDEEREAIEWSINDQIEGGHQNHPIVKEVIVTLRTLLERMK